MDPNPWLMPGTGCQAEARSVMSHNDEVERRGASPTTNEADLSQSPIPSLAYRRRDPRSLEPIVRGGHAETFAHVMSSVT